MEGKPKHMNELEILARKYGTDKRNNDPGQSIYHGYTDAYYKYMFPRKHDIKNLLEIGVREGYSHSMWADFLPNAKIYGIDNFSDPACSVSKEEIESNPKIKVIVGDQSDKDTTRKFEDIPLDIIIDDGSHMSWHQQKSFDLLWDYLLLGGYYFIEDLAVCYERKFREFDNARSSTLDWLQTIKNGIIPFSYYIKEERMNEIFNQFETISSFGELFIIQKSRETY